MPNSSRQYAPQSCLFQADNLRLQCGGVDLNQFKMPSCEQELQVLVKAAKPFFT